MFARINMDVAAEALASIGIATKDVSGELRSASQIYSEVASKWDTLSRAQKTYIGEALAGKFHITRFLALMDNYKISIDATNIAQQSLFSSFEENQKHMESLQSQINQVKTAAQELSYALGEAGVKSAISGVLGITKTFVNGLTEMTKSSGWTKAGVLALTVSVAGLTIGFASMIPIVKGAALALAQMVATIAANPLGLFAITLTAIISTMVIYHGKQKQLREEQEKLSKTVAESTEKFKELKDAMYTVGKPTMEQINQTQGMIKSYEDLTKSIEKAREASKQEIVQNFKNAFYGADISKLKIDVPYEPDKLSEDIKLLSANLRLNIYEFKTYEQLLSAIKIKQDELNATLRVGQKNSTEYQAEQIRLQQTQLDLANNNKALVDEYFNLNAIQNRNEEQTKRLAEVKRMLMAMFPEEWNNGKNIQKLLTEEAKKRVQLAETNVDQAKRQLEASRSSQQIAYETAVKNIAYYQAEIKTLKALWDARANATSTGSSTNSMADFRVIDNLGMAERKFDNAKAKANDLAEILKEIDNVLNFKAAPVSGGSSKSSGGSKSGKGTTMENQLEKYISLTKQAQNEYFELYNLATKKIELGIIPKKDILEQRFKDYESYVNKLFDLTSNLNQKIADIEAKRNDYKKGSKEWNNATQLIAKYKADLKELPALQKASVKTLERINAQLKYQNAMLEDANKLAESWKSNISEVVGKIKEIGTSFKDTMKDIGTSNKLNKQFNTNLFGSVEELMSQTLEAYKTEIYEYSKNFDLIYNTRNDKLKRLNDLSLKLAKGTATESDKILLQSLKESEDISLALKEMGLTVEDVIRKNEEFVRVIKQYEAFKKASERVSELTDKIKSFAEEFKGIQLDKEFELQFTNQYKEFIDVLKDTPTEPVDILQKQLDDTKDKFSQLLEESKKLEQMKFDVSDVSLDEFKTKAKEISKQIVQEGFDGSQFSSFFNQYADIWSGNVLNFTQFQEAAKKFKEELSKNETLKPYYNMFSDKLDELEQVKTDWLKATTTAEKTALAQKANTLRSDISSLVQTVLSQQVSSSEIIDNDALNEAIENANSFEEVMVAINEQLALNNSELYDTADAIKQMEEELKKANKELEVTNKLRDVFSNIFSFDNLWVEKRDEFGNVLKGMNDSVVKTLQQSSTLVDQIFEEVKTKLSDLMLSMLTDNEGFISKLLDGSGISDAFTQTFISLEDKFESTLSGLGSQASNYFSTSFQSDILKGMGSLDSVLGELMSASLNAIPTVVSEVLQTLPNMFLQLTNSMSTGVVNSLTTILNKAIETISSALRVDIPLLDMIQPTVNRIENTSTQTEVFNASMPTNITYAYNINGILLYREGALRELAYAIKDVLQEETANAW